MDILAILKTLLQLMPPGTVETTSALSFSQCTVASGSFANSGDVFKSEVEDLQHTDLQFVGLGPAKTFHFFSLL